MKRSLVIVAAITTALSLNANAGTTQYHSGQSCEGTGYIQILSSSGQTQGYPTINRNSSGIYNTYVNPWSGIRNNQSVYCPNNPPSTTGTDGTGNPATVIDNATLIYNDADNNTSSGQGNFNCYVNVVNWDGSVSSSSSRYSCGSYGGCFQDTTIGFVGGGQMNWSSPFGSTTFYARNITIYCSLPSFGSYIAGYNVTTN